MIQPGPTSPVICTIVAKNYLAHARVLCASFHEQHPDGRAYVLVIDEPEGRFAPAAELFTVLFLPDIVLPEASGTFTFKYDVVELATAVKPYLLEHLFNDLGEHAVIYLDPDILVTGSLLPLFERLETGSGVLLTPHLDSDLPRDGRMPNDGLFLTHGAYNLGFLGVRRGSAAARTLRWLGEKLAHECAIDPRRGLFVDQKFFDLAVSLFPDLEIERGVGYNAAYWNSHSRMFSRAADGSWQANEEPLRFFHFSGYRPEQPEVISRHQNRHHFNERPDLAALYAGYYERLLAAGYEQCRHWPYTYQTFSNGVRVPARLRQLLRDVPALRRRWPDPFHNPTLRRSARAVRIAERGLAWWEKVWSRLRRSVRARLERRGGQSEATPASS